MSETFKIVKLLDPLSIVNIPSGLVPKGAYNAGTNYTVGDSVDYLGSSYVQYVDAPAGTLPTDTTYWQVLANKGNAGATGATGPQGPAGVGGGITRTITSISSPTTAGATASTDYVYLISGTTTLTLPTAVGNTNRYTVTNVGVNTVTVATTSAQTINGSSTATLPIANMSLDFISNNSSWVVE